MHSKIAGAFLTCLLVAAAVSVGTAADGTTITGVDVEGDGLATVTDDETFVWQEGTSTMNVTVATGAVSDPNHEVCVRAPELDEGQQELGCEVQRLEENTTTTISVPVSEWPAGVEATSVALEVTLSEALTDTYVDETNASVTVIARDGQFDGDQLSNERELELGTDLSSKDTDGDGLWDGQEVDDVGSSPVSTDTDDDGVPDAVEVDYGTDPTVADTDGDGLSDDAEINQYSSDPLDEDTDGDGLSDGREVHELGSSPTAVDTDDDGLDDPTEVEIGTDPDEADSDDDGLTDGEEYNQYDTDPLEADTDGDGVEDGREVEELDTNPRVADADSDGDLLSDEFEQQIGTDPGSAFSPWGYVALLVGATVVAGWFAYRSGWRVRRENREVRGRQVRVPTVTRGGGRSAVGDRSTTRGGQSHDAGRNQTADIDRTPGSTTDPGERGSQGSSRAGTRELDTESGDEVEPGGEGDARTTSTDQRGDVADAGDEAESLPDHAFLTDADRVKHLLEEAGGNCRQQDIVRETGWSKSKVSRLLSRMADDDEIRKISLGRENVIVLPGEEPDAVRSALDDE